MKKTLLTAALALACIFAASCGDPYPDRPVKKKKDKSDKPGRLARDADSDQKDWMIEATKNELRLKKSQLTEAYEEIENLKTQLRGGETKVEQLNEALEKRKRLCADYEREVRRQKSLYIALEDKSRRNELELERANKTLEEWNTFYKEYEKEIAQYKEFIEGQDAIIKRLEQMVEDPPDTAPEDSSSIPDRLVPEDSKLITRRQFYSIVQGMSTAELKDYLGSPNSTSGSNPEYYTYNRPMTYSADPSRPDSSVRISIVDDAVKQCFFTE